MLHLIFLPLLHFQETTLTVSHLIVQLLRALFFDLWSFLHTLLLRCFSSFTCFYFAVFFFSPAF